MHHTEEIICWIKHHNDSRDNEDAWFIVALYLYPLNARLYSQLLHRPPGMGDVIGTVSLRRHPGRINTVMKNDREKLDNTEDKNL